MSKIRAGILSAASPPPVAFNAAAFVASAIVDQDFTGLGGTPGAWAVTGGTEDYNVDGLTQASATALAMRLDISGSAVADIPGWLLVNFSYTDVADANILAETANLADTRRQTASFVGNGGLDYTTDHRRTETDNLVDCFTGGASNFQDTNPSANEAWLGVNAFFTSPADQYEAGVFYLVTDPDFVSLGIFSGDPCGDFEPDTIKYVRFTLAGTAAGDVTIKRILFWDDFPPSSGDVVAVLAVLGFVVSSGQIGEPETYVYVGETQQVVTAPEGATRAVVTAAGCSGGSGVGGAGGAGGVVTCDVSVSPGEIFHVIVGTDGADNTGVGGFHGGGTGSNVGGFATGGGGGTVTVTRDPFAFGDAVVIGPGGGGAGFSLTGGAGGTPDGGDSSGVTGGTQSGGGLTAGAGADGGTNGAALDGGTSGNYAGGGGGGFFGGGGGGLSGGQRTGGGGGSGLSTGVNETLSSDNTDIGSVTFTWFET